MQQTFFSRFAASFPFPTTHLHAWVNWPIKVDVHLGTAQFVCVSLSSGTILCAPWCESSPDTRVRFLVGHFRRVPLCLSPSLLFCSCSQLSDFLTYVHSAANLPIILPVRTVG